MIDIRIGPLQPPTRGIRREVVLHVFMQVLLQIDPTLAEGAHYYVRTNAGFNRHIAVRIRDLLIGGVLTRCLADLFDGAIDREFELRRTLGRQRHGFRLLFGWFQRLDGPGDLLLAGCAS